MEINSLRKLTMLGHKTSLLCPVWGSLVQQRWGITSQEWGRGSPTHCHSLGGPLVIFLKDQKVYINGVHWKVYIYFHIWWEENLYFYFYIGDIKKLLQFC